jgi:parallel beta-helix repeat protein
MPDDTPPVDPTAPDTDVDVDQDDESGVFAPADHDHSGAYGTSRNLGREAPVESITTEAVYTREEPVVNVKAYGAEGDGETDDHAAIQRAVTEAPERAVLYLPSGTYRSSDAITVRDKSLTVTGDGVGGTVIEFVGATDGLAFSQPSSGDAALEDERYVAVRDLSLRATRPASGTAISSVWEDPPSGAFPHLVVRNVEAGAADDAGFFTGGVRCRNAWRARVYDFHFVGRQTPGPTGAGTERGADVVGVDLRARSVDSSVTTCHFSGCDVAIRAGDPQAGVPATEGVRIHEATVEDAERGVVAYGGPWMTVTNSTFAVRRTGVEFHGRWEAMVNNCEFDAVGTGGVDWTGVRVLDTRNIHVSNVSVESLPTHAGDHRGVSVEGSQDCKVEGNTVSDAGSGEAAIAVEDSTNVNVYGNVAGDAECVVKLGDGARQTIAVGNRGNVVDDGRLNLVANNLSS